MATMPLRQGQQCHRNDGKDACALMMMTMPFQQGQRHQLEDDNNAIATRATTPSQIKGNNTIVPRATTPAWQRQGCLCINNGNDPIVMRATIAITTIAKTPAHQWWQRHHDKEHDTSSMASNKGNITSLIMAETPAHWQQQWCHCDESNNCHCDNGKDTCALTATSPSWWGQQCQLDNQQQGQQS
jgi:hypothetical protein